MKKQPYILNLVSPHFSLCLSISEAFLRSLDLEWTSLFQDLEKAEKVLLS